MTQENKTAKKQISKIIKQYTATSHTT